MGKGLSEEEFSKKELMHLDSFFKNQVDPKSTAAIILELVQGEGGFNIAPKSYVKGLRELCDHYGILLIFDEVQTGFCRTGKWGAHHHYNITPDISTWAKSMGSGMPIGAVVGKAEIMDKAAPGTIGGTYLGNPVCCAAAIATIKVMEEMNLNKKAQDLGSLTFEKFKSFDSPKIGDIRGIGAMVALEFVKGKITKEPDADFCAKVADECLKKNLILLRAGTHKNIIRFLSPLTISFEDYKKGLDIIEKSIKRNH